MVSIVSDGPTEVKLAEPFREFSVGWLFLWGTSGWLLLAIGLGVILSGMVVYAVRETMLRSGPKA